MTPILALQLPRNQLFSRYCDNHKMCQYCNYIQDVFDKCGSGKTRARVDAVADAIRSIGYEVVTGVYGTGRELSEKDQCPREGSPENAFINPSSGEYNYTIFSIMRPDVSGVGVGEYVYGSADPGVLPGDNTGCSEEEMLRRWPLSGHKSLPHYLVNHIDELIIGPGKKLVTALEVNEEEICFGYGGGCFYNATRAEWAAYQGPERVGEGDIPVGVSGCGSPDQLTFARFIDIFYLDSTSMSSCYRQWHIEHLIRTGAVNTIANTLPTDIVVELYRYIETHGIREGKRWEFIVPETVDIRTQTLRHTSCMKVSVGGICLPLACPCPEPRHPEPDTSSVMAVCGRYTPDSGSGSSSEDDD